MAKGLLGLFEKVFGKKGRDVAQLQPLVEQIKAVRGDYAALNDDELRQVRLKLDSAGVRMVTYYIHLIPGDEAGCRKVFEFGRKMGIETCICEPLPEARDTIERFCDEYDINVAIHFECCR